MNGILELWDVIAMLGSIHLAVGGFYQLLIKNVTLGDL